MIVIVTVINQFWEYDPSISYEMTAVDAAWGVGVDLC